MTPFQFQCLYEGAQKRDVALAWHTAALASAAFGGKLPKLETLLQSRPDRTPEEYARLKALIDRENEEELKAK